MIKILEFIRRVGKKKSCAKFTKIYSKVNRKKYRFKILNPKSEMFSVLIYHGLKILPLTSCDDLQ